MKLNHLNLVHVNKRLINLINSNRNEIEKLIKANDVEYLSNRLEFFYAELKFERDLVYNQNINTCLEKLNILKHIYSKINNHKQQKGHNALLDVFVAALTLLFACFGLIKCARPGYVE